MEIFSTLTSNEVMVSSPEIQYFTHCLHRHRHTLHGEARKPPERKLRKYENYYVLHTIPDVLEAFREKLLYLLRCSTSWNLM